MFRTGRKLTAVIARVQTFSVVNLNANMVGAFASYCLKQGGGKSEFVEDWLEWYSATVRASEMHAPHTWWKALCDAFGTPYGIIRLGTRLS